MTEQQKLTEKYYIEYTNKIKTAIEKTSLPYNNEVVMLYGKHLLWHYRRGTEKSAEDCSKFVEKKYKKSLKK